VIEMECWSIGFLNPSFHLSTIPFFTTPKRGD
jgi:hypothetical protein